MNKPLFEAKMEHVPVLRNDVQKYLELKGGEVVVDGTLGLGGHSLDMLKVIGKKGSLIAFEQDGRNLEEAQKRLKDFEKQITYVHDNFRYLKNRITEAGFKEIDAILLDLGLSSAHVDDPERGFSFNKDGPLDMRFDPRAKFMASDVINAYREDDLVRIFFQYGEEKMAKKIAREICKRRATQNFTSTVELAEFISSILPEIVKRKSKVHPATRVFQALRIEVNEELKVLEEVLEQAMEMLKIGGRIVIISYHSLEDRIVKHFFKELERPAATAEESIYSNYGDPIIEVLTKKPVSPSEEEIKENPRSRSAKLRAYKKIKKY